MSIQYDAFGAPISETIHEVASVEPWPRTETTPAEVTVRCVCGWEFTSIESAGGGVEAYGPAFEEHVDDMGGLNA